MTRIGYANRASATAAPGHFTATPGGHLTVAPGARAYSAPGAHPTRNAQAHQRREPQDVLRGKHFVTHDQHCDQHCRKRQCTVSRPTTV